jgi:hypothetical protein
MKIYPELNTSSWYKDDFTLDCNAWLHTLKGVVSRQAVSLSQPSATRYNTGTHMLSTVDTWGRMQYFFKPSFAIATTSFCSVSLMEDELTPGAPTNKMQSYAISITTMHW